MLTAHVPCVSPFRGPAKGLSGPLIAFEPFFISEGIHIHVMKQVRGHPCLLVKSAAQIASVAAGAQDGTSAPPAPPAPPASHARAMGRLPHISSRADPRVVARNRLAAQVPPRQRFAVAVHPRVLADVVLLLVRRDGHQLHVRIAPSAPRSPSDGSSCPPLSADRLMSGETPLPNAFGLGKHGAGLCCLVRAPARAPRARARTSHRRAPPPQQCLLFSCWPMLCPVICGVVERKFVMERYAVIGAHGVVGGDAVDHLLGCCFPCSVFQTHALLSRVESAASADEYTVLVDEPADEPAASAPPAEAVPVGDAVAVAPAEGGPSKAEAMKR